MPNVVKKIAFWAKIATFCVLVGFVAHTLHQQTLRWADLRQTLLRPHWLSGWAVLVVGLVPLNWSLEALKWQALARQVWPMRFGEALNGVLAGLSLSMALPGPLGDTAGRVLWVRAPHRAGALGAAAVAGGMQFYVAVVAGAVAWAVYLPHVPGRQTTSGTLLLALLAGLSGVGVVLNFLRPNGLVWLEKWAFAARYRSYWQVIGQYSHARMAGVFGLALLRHFTFSVQLFAAFRLYAVNLANEPLAAGVGVIYLVKTMAPALNWLSDLGVREAAALWVFAPFTLPAPPLLAATLTVWLVNIGVPGLAGLVSLWRIR